MAINEFSEKVKLGQYHHTYHVAQPGRKSIEGSHGGEVHISEDIFKASSQLWTPSPDPDLVNPNQIYDTALVAGDVIVMQKIPKGALILDVEAFVNLDSVPLDLSINVGWTDSKESPYEYPGLDLAGLDGGPYVDATIDYPRAQATSGATVDVIPELASINSKVPTERQNLTGFFSGISLAAPGDYCSITKTSPITALGFNKRFKANTWVIVSLLATPTLVDGGVFTIRVKYVKN